jgi:hypothetical protein
MWGLLVRPTKYEPRFALELIDFFTIDVFTTDAFGRKKVNRFPTFERFAVGIGVTHKTLLNWMQVPENSEFLRAYEMCRDLQKALLIEGGLGGDYNNNFAKFLAVNVTDLRDRVEQEINQKTVQINIDRDDAEV